VVLVDSLRLTYFNIRQLISDDGRANTQFSSRRTTDNRVQLDFVGENEVLSLSSLSLFFPRLRQLLTEERAQQLRKN
jgi:hypothetical protein